MTGKCPAVILPGMPDDLCSGHVTSFRREQGFGVITLDDGRDVKFDASACTMVPEEGAPVQLRVAPARWGGGFKAVHVEPRGSSAGAALARAAAASSPPARLAEHLAALHRGQITDVPSEAPPAEHRLALDDDAV